MIGAALHTLIATLVLVRKQKRPGEKIFLFLVTAVGIWHLGNLLALVLSRLPLGEWRAEATFARTLALCGLGLFPALLVHTHVAFLRETTLRASHPKMQNVLLALLYLPLLWFLYPLSIILASPTTASLQILTPYILQYVCWFVTALAISAIIDMRLASLQEDEPFRHFYRVIGVTFLFIALLTTFSYILGGRELPRVGGYLELMSIIASIIPSTILAYFIYRYNFLELVIRRSFFVITLSIVIFGVYFLGIRQLTLYLSTYFEIVPGLFEAMSVLALVVTFPAYKKWLQKRVNQIFFREFGYYHELFSELEQTINRIFGLQSLVDYVQKAAAKMLFLDSVNLTIFELQDSTIKHLATSFTSVPNIEKTVHKIESDNPRQLRIEDVKEEEIISEMKAMNATLVIPIRHKTKLMGLFAFRARPPRRPILTQELEMLRSLAAQTAMSVASALLMEEKLKLEREVAQKERMASIGQMAATIAHEIKNPLSSIKSITQSLSEQQTDESTRQDLDMINREVDRLNFSSNQLLRFARSSSSDITDVSVVMTMEHVIRILQNECKTQNVQIKHHYNGHIPSIFGSAFGLQDIFLNLLLNALQAMPSGGEINIEYQKNGRFLMVMISDSGPGIRPDLIARIFDPFFTTKQKGTGLGLAVVKQKMTEFGGDIEAHNLKPHGSRFTLSFPMERIK